MKRLINADALTNKYGDWYTEEGTEEGFIGCLKQLIDEQPTIEAIPIEWIIRKRNEHNNDGFAWIFEVVLEDWKREHEKTD